MLNFVRVHYYAQLYVVLGVELGLIRALCQLSYTPPAPQLFLRVIYTSCSGITVNVILMYIVL